MQITASSMNTKEKTLEFLSKIIAFGLLLFYSGIYIFPDGGDMNRVFYAFVMLPMLYVIFTFNKEFFADKYFWLLMLLPIYLTASHFWADEENIIRSNFFHIKKVIYIFFFLSAVFYSVKKWPNFLRLLFQTLFIVGFLSAVTSIACFISEKCGIHGGRLSGFSVQDINKAGAIYTLQMGLSAFFLVYGFFKEKKNSATVYIILLLGFFVSGYAVVLAKTHATWFMLIITLFLILIPKWTTKIACLLIFIFLLSGILFYYFNAHAILMQDASYRIRLDLAYVSLVSLQDNILFGLGLTHKLPFVEQGVIYGSSYSLPHPHNIFIDVLRFGGVVGFLVLVFNVFFLTVSGVISTNKHIVIKFCLAWFVAGVAIMTVYAQQPITRPGGYVWFLYWMPIAILAAELSRLENERVV